jgi:hypothetical protein
MQSDKLKNKNSYFTKASFIEQTLEGEGDTFRFHLKHETLATKCTKVISRTKK